MWTLSLIKFNNQANNNACSVIPAHPWVYGLGQQTENGTYLSPTNAVSYLADQLVSAGDISDVVIFLITGSGHDEFMQNLNGLVDVLPVPAMMQVKRLAQSAAELSTERMLIPSPATTSVAAVPFSTPTTRAALNAQRIAEAQTQAASGFSLAEAKAALTGFIQERSNILSEVASGLESLKGKSARAWAFTAQGDITTTLRTMVKDIPAASAVHCAAVMMVGENLAGLREMIHELDSDAGA
ncbi:hypothetical protein RJQ11_07435 [Klebsiella pneumoniae]|uniref:hypothetical protein n=1 Tax=Klebsiella pneumoniae TaxID=573 RepID=UPI0004EDA418|nr:hypothetical protein [Klebsiella pneumoniae]AIK80235.1 hypothetical protein VK055_1615 [Klebsiella pneumoniae subsp. pneumoniae]EKU9004570.1 hypothetical protein [Klebsiella pneumoniae]KMH91168.1 hypothetical protein SM80_00904 [Klebsiella pneumoniae]MBU5709640.1 hypothetical protein [Klebsiella pneumoniae]MDW5539621.1 hypothetical protein [Klebsiella pneumoniae]